jgi:DNA-binding CsgD family transcriptional regulator
VGETQRLHAYDLPLLEREADLAELGDAVAAAGAGDGRLVIIEGAAGAGKSRLLAATTGLAAAAGLRVLRASGSELERDFAFGAVRQLLEPPVVAAPPAVRQRLLAGAAAPASWVLGQSGNGPGGNQGAGGGPAGNEPSAGASVMLHALYWLAANLAADGPLLIAVEDLHWVDEASARALAYLARRLADVPIALVVTLRPHEPGSPEDAVGELGQLPGAVTITPRPLSAAGVAGLVRARLPGADDRLCAACAEVSGGNPLYLQELLRAVAAGGIQSAAAVRQASVPSLGDRVMRRVRQVALSAPALAGAMAVLGDRAPLSLAAQLAGLDEVTASRLARRLVRIEVLASEDPATFVHPVIRRSVYDALTPAERDDAHRAAARLLGPRAPVEAVAAQLAAVRPAGSAEAAATLAAAAEEALRRAAPEAGIRWLRRALAEDATHDAAGPDRARLLFRLGQAEMSVRDLAAVDDLGAALALADGDDELHASIAVTLVELLCTSGRWERGLELAQATLARAGGQPRLVLEVTAPMSAARAYDPRLAPDFARDRERLLLLAQGDSWPARALTALLAATAVLRDGDCDQATALARRSLDGGQLLERNAGGWAGAQLMWALTAVDELDWALAVSDQIETAARRAGSLTGVVTATVYRAFVHARRGALADAEALLLPAIAMAVESGLGMWMTTGYWLLAEALLERPSLDPVAADVESLELEPAFMATMSGAMLLEVRGRLRRQRGDRAGAEADLRACGATAALVAPSPCFSAWRSELALALPPAAGAEARALIDEELTRARASGLGRPEGIALRAAGVQAGGADGIARLRDSLAVLERCEAPLEQARTLVGLGAALRRAGQRTQARGPLADGLELARRCGAERLADRADQELRAAGARPRRAARSGVDAFTASELRVARLAARGQPNEAIAQELYVSRKTVETHLSHVYAKLGLSGQGAREALGETLASHDKSSG